MCGVRLIHLLCIWYAPRRSSHLEATMFVLLLLTTHALAARDIVEFDCCHITSADRTAAEPLEILLVPPADRQPKLLRSRAARRE